MSAGLQTRFNYREMAFIQKFLRTTKPIFEIYLRTSNLESLEELKQDLDSFAPDEINNLQTFILLPLVMKVDDLELGSNTNAKVRLLNVIKGLLANIHINDIKALKTTITVLLKEIYNLDGGQLIKDVIPEEIKIEIVGNLTIILTNCTYDIKENFYVKENNGLIGRMVSSCVQLISTEKYRALRIASIECIMAICYVHDESAFNDDVLRRKVADCIFLYIPKVMATLIEAAIGDDMHGQTLRSVSTRALGRILCLIYEDYDAHLNVKSLGPKDFLNLVNLSKLENENNHDDDNILGSNIKNINSEERLQKFLSIERTDQWLEASSRKLISLFKRLELLRGTGSSLIRKEYAIMCCTLLEKCSRFLKNSCLSFLETIIALSQDTDQVISGICAKCISKIPENDLYHHIDNLLDIHLIRLPRIIYRNHGDEQYSEFLFLKGFFKILPNNCLRNILSCANNLEQFCSCLISALHLEIPNDCLNEEYSIRLMDDENKEPIYYQWRKYKNIDDHRVINVLAEILECLGKCNIVDLIFYKSMEMMSENPELSNEVIILLILLLCGKNNTSNNLELISLVLEEILEEYHWHLALQAREMSRIYANKAYESDWIVDRTPGLYESAIEIRKTDIESDDHEIDKKEDIITIADAQFNVIHTCILLDAVGHFSQTLKGNFKPFLFKSLHKVLQKSGSSNFLVHQAGNFALEGLKLALDYKAISDIVYNNSDYITYHINTAIKKVNKNQSALDILNVVLSHSSVSSISHLELILNTIMDDLHHNGQEYNKISYLKIFHTFLMGIRKWTKEKENELLEINPPEANTTLDDSYENWLQIINKKDEVLEEFKEACEKIDDPDMDSRLENDIEDENIGSEEAYNEATVPELPKYIQIVIRVLKVVRTFVPAKDQAQKIVSLECLNTGIPILKDYENELLPIIDSIWYPFAERFKDKDPITLNRCFTLLETLSFYAKDFVLQRTLKNVIPHLNEFLIQSVKISKEGCSIHTQTFKLQKTLLQKYANVIISMDIQERELDSIIDAIIPYLNKNQPKALQDSAVEYFKSVSLHNCGLVYIKLLGKLELKEYVKYIFKK